MKDENEGSDESVDEIAENVVIRDSQATTEDEKLENLQFRATPTITSFIGRQK